MTAGISWAEERRILCQSSRSDGDSKTVTQQDSKCGASIITLPAKASVKPYPPWFKSSEPDLWRAALVFVKRLRWEEFVGYVDLRCNRHARSDKLGNMGKSGNDDVRNWTVGVRNSTANGNLTESNFTGCLPTCCKDEEAASHTLPNTTEKKGLSLVRSHELSLGQDVSLHGFFQFSLGRSRW